MSLESLCVWNVVVQDEKSDVVFLILIKSILDHSSCGKNIQKIVIASV